MPATDVKRPTRSRRRWAWLVAAAPLAPSATLSSSLRAAGLAEHTVVGLGLLVGVTCGVVWQNLDRCDLVDRFAGPAVLVPLVGVLLLLPGSADGTASVGNVAGPALAVGVVSGLVLAEQWMRQRVRP